MRQPVENAQFTYSGFEDIPGSIPSQGQFSVIDLRIRNENYGQGSSEA